VLRHCYVPPVSTPIRDELPPVRYKDRPTTSTSIDLCHACRASTSPSNPSSSLAHLRTSKSTPARTGESAYRIALLFLLPRCSHAARTSRPLRSHHPLLHIHHVPSSNLAPQASATGQGAGKGYDQPRRIPGCRHTHILRSCAGSKCPDGEATE